MLVFYLHKQQKGYWNACVCLVWANSMEACGKRGSFLVGNSCAQEEQKSTMVYVLVYSRLHSMDSIVWIFVCLPELAKLVVCFLNGPQTLWHRVACLIESIGTSLSDQLVIIVSIGMQFGLLSLRAITDCQRNDQHSANRLIKQFGTNNFNNKNLRREFLFEAIPNFVTYRTESKRSCLLETFRCQQTTFFQKATFLSFEDDQFHNLRQLTANKLPPATFQQSVTSSY